MRNRRKKIFGIHLIFCVDVVKETDTDKLGLRYDNNIEIPYNSQ